MCPSRCSLVSRALWVGVVALVVMAPAAPAECGVFESKHYYRLLRDFNRELRKPEQSAEEKQSKAEALAGIAVRARRMWNQSNGTEQMGGTPPNAIGSMGTEPIHYRPRLIDLFANWKAARLTEDEAQKSTFYRNVGLALPPGFEDWPAPYREPMVYALVVDANLHLGTDLSEALAEWARLASSRRSSVNALIAHLRQPERPELNELEPGFPAKAINIAYLQVCQEVGSRLRDCVKITAGAELGLAREEPLTVAGRYEGLVPIRLWTENERGASLSDEVELAPNSDFFLPLNKITEGDSGNSVLRWRFPPGAVPDFLIQGFGQNKFAVEGWTAGYTYRVFRRRVGFSVFQASRDRTWVTGPGGLNRDVVSIGYSSDAQAGSFHWKLLDESNREVIPDTVEDKPDNLLTIERGKLGRGRYTLHVREDPTNPDPEISGRFTKISTFSVTGPGVALVIGVNAYFDPGSSLMHACDDADAIMQHLRSNGYTDEDIIWVKGTGSDALDAQILEKTGTITGTRKGLVTTDVLADALDKFRALVRRRSPSRALLFFSGHGQTVVQDDGSALHELIPGDYSDKAGEPERVYLTQFLEVIDELDSSAGAPTYVALIDACRSLENPKPHLRPTRAGPYPSKGYLLVPVYSCNLNEMSNESGDRDNAITFESETVTHGFFTYALLQGLKAVPDGKLGPVLSNGAVDVMRKLMAKAGDRNAKLKGAGDPTRKLPFSQRQTITVGDLATESPESVQQLPKDVFDAMLF